MSHKQNDIYYESLREAIEELEANIPGCEHCGKKTDFIPCHGCGVNMMHDKNGMSISHRCYSCNVEDGKGE